MIDSTYHVNQHFLNIANLPKEAQQELISFCEYLRFKYQTPQDEKQQVLTKLFQEADGKLPTNYHFNREDLYE